MRANDPNEWANKRKAQMENAKKLREERKNGINDAENATFAPQINKRPQYLNQQKDTLDNEVRIQTNDIFEQPLPGARAKQQAQEQFGGLPSPGSDALGKEMKTHNPSMGGGGVGRTRHPDGLTDAQYKSKFLQQYETEKQQKNRINLEASEYAPPQRQQQQQYQQQQEQEDQFAQILRSDGGRSAGPGWNDDTSSNGFVSKKVPSSVPANRHIVKKAPAAPAAHKQPSSYSDNYEQQRFQEEQPIRQQQQAQEQVRQPPRQSSNRPPPRQQQEWSMDGDCGIPDLPPPRASGVKVSPRGGVSGIPVPGGVQQSKLSLLKSKIRSSESSGSARTTSSANSYQQDYANGSGSGMIKSNSSHAGSTFGGSNLDDMPVGGGGADRRSTAPNMYGSSAYDDGDYNQAQQRNPAPKAGRRGPPLQAAAAPTQQSQNDMRYQQQQQPPTQPSHSQQQQPQQQRGQYSQQAPNDGYQPNFNSNPPARRVVPPANNTRGGGFRAGVDDEDDDQYSQPMQQQQQQRNNQPPPQRQQPPPQQQQQQRAPPVQQFTSEYPPGGGPPSEYPDEEEVGGGEQMECPDCGRKFNPVPYQKHVKICAKVFLTKRKAFDSTKMRVNDNPELVQILNKVKKEEKKKAAKTTAAPPQAAAAAAQQAATNSRFAPDKPAAADDGGKAKWKEQSEAFREAMKAARNYSKAVATGAPLPPPVAPTIDKSLIECPNCNRRFNEKAAERHIPLCKNIINKPTQLKRGAGGGGGMNGTSTAKGGSSKGNGKW